jgi:phosphinothricin acetyltransferase
MQGIVRFAAAADMPEICTIVNHYIETGTANFRTALQTSEEWIYDWRQYHEHYPWLVAQIGTKIAGVTYAGPWNKRDAYAWCAETTIYVSRHHLGRGLGVALYKQLLKILEKQGFRTALAVISLPNPASVRLHESMGYTHTGTIERAGFKLGGWHDVGFWQRHFHLGAESPNPTAPVPDMETEAS